MVSIIQPVETVRIVIDNPADADNIAPIFNSTNWVDTHTIFCDESSSSFDRCGDGVEINLLDYFSDPDGVGDPTNHMVFDIYNDPQSAFDDDYAYHIRITPDGVAVYNPMDSMYQTSSNPTDWSMQGVTFEARDSYDSVAYSFQVNFIIQSVKFSVERLDSGSVSSGDSAEFRGTALPFSVVNARLFDSGAKTELHCSWCRWYLEYEHRFRRFTE